MNAVVDFTVYILLTRNLPWWQEHYLWASALGFYMANINSFLWNRYWTFAVKHGSVWRQYFSFLGSSLAYLGIMQVGLWALVSVFNIYDLLAKVVVIGLSMILYFAVLRHVVFWPKSKAEPQV